jgi:hypothetical protein
MPLLEGGQLMNRPQPSAGHGSDTHPRDRHPDKKRDVENLITELEQSPSVENTGTIVLNHVAEYDDEFFDALTELAASSKARGRTARVQTLEAMQDYLRYVCRRARAGQSGQMRAELATGAADDASPDNG